MRKKIRGGISILVAAAMLLTGGGAGIAAGAEEAVQAEAAQEATAVEAEPVETGDAGTEAGIAPIAFPNDIDPDAQMDEIVEDGIRELSTVDKSQFIEESEIDKVNTAYVPARFETFTRNYTSFASQPQWDNIQKNGQLNLGANRYVWLQLEMGDEVQKILSDPAYQNYNLVQANVRMAHVYNRTAGGMNRVWYIPDNSWTSAENEDAGGKALTYNNSLTYFDQGTDIGSGMANGGNNTMKLNTFSADGISAFDVSKENYRITVVVGGTDTGADMASSYLTPENNYNQPLIDEYRPSFQMTYSNANAQQIKYQIDRPYVLEKIRKIIAEYDNTETIADFTAISDENDVTVAYSIEDEASKQWASVDGASIHITRPTAEQGSKDIVIHVRTQRGDVIMAYDLNMTILAEQEVSPTLESSLKAVADYAEQTLEQQKADGNIAEDPADETPGKLSQEAADALETAIADARACSDPADMSTMIQNVIRTGQTFMGSGTICNDILYHTKNPYLDAGNTLVYSEARANLEGLVWKAKATLLNDPDMYTENAKKTLQVEIERAEKALQVDEDGTSMLKLPFVKTRMYYSRRDDEMIQHATRYTTKFTNYNGGSYGLQPVLEWYPSAHILYNAYTTIEIPATFMGFINSSQPDVWTGDKNIVIGKLPNDRIAMFQYDLHGINGLKSAQIRMVDSNTNGYTANVFLEPDDHYTNNAPTWNQMVEKNGPYQSAGVGVVSGQLIGTHKAAGKGNASYTDLTEAALSEAAGDGILTISMQLQREENFPLDFFSTGTAQNVTQLPTFFAKTSDISEKQLRERVTTLIDNQKYIFDSAETYTGDVRNAEVGQLEKTSYDAAIAAMEHVESELDSASIYTIAKDAVKFMNAAYECRMSIALSSDVDVDENGVQKGNIFYSGEQVEELKQLIKTNDYIRNAYESMKNSMKTVKLDVSRDWWERFQKNDLSLYREYPSFTSNPASSGGKYTSGRHVSGTDGKELPANLPAGHTYTGKAYVTIELEPEDNDTTGYLGMNGGGCGEAWVDNFVITSDESHVVEIPNADFEVAAVSGSAPLNWTLSTTGNGEGKWESDRRNVYSGNRSLYLHNPDGNSSVKWTSSVFDLPITSSADGFDVYWSIQQYGVFEKAGPQVKFHFLTETADGESEVVSRPQFYNAKGKPSSTGIGGVGQTMQRAAILAMLEDNSKERDDYLELAKIYLNMQLDEMNQGVEHWFRFDQRPDGADAFGAVQTGRVAAGVAAAYSCIKNMKFSDGTPAFTDEERAEVTEKAAYMIRALNDIRDLYDLAYDEVPTSGGNWSSDMNSGATMLSLAFIDTLPEARVHFYNGMRFSEVMLLANMNEDGSWPEAVRYHNGAVSKLAVLAKALRSSTGYDWFANPDIEFYKAFDYLTWIQTPTYASGNCSTPFYGDHILSSGDELFMCGLYYDEIAEVQPEVALRMYGTWLNAGTPTPTLGNEDVQISALFGHMVDINDYGNYKEAMKKIGSTDYAKYFGTFIFRNNFMKKGYESWLSIMLHEGPEIGHAHKDQMSFIMYADNIPLVVDPGSAPTYWGGSAGFYKQSAQHAVVTYEKAPGSYEDTDVNSTQRGWYASDSLDLVKGSSKRYNTTSDAAKMRDIAFIKNGFEAYVILDQVTGADYGTMMNLPLLTRSKNAITQNGNKFTAGMFGGIDLEITYLQGNYESNEVLTYGATGPYQLREDEDTPQVDHLRIHNQGNDPYLTVLFPKTRRRGNLTTEDLGNGVYKLTHSSGNIVYVAVNTDRRTKSVRLPEGNVTDLESLNNASPTVYADGVVSVPGNSMKLLTPKVATTQEVEQAGGSTTQTPEPSRPGGTTGSATPGAAAGGGAAAPSNDPTNYVTGNNVNSDLTKPGVAGKPSADINDSKAAKGKLAFDVTGDADVYYSVNGSDYKKYSGTDNSLSEGRNTVVYFTVDRSTGGKTRGISEVITVGASSGNGDDTILEDADTAVEVYRNLAVGQKAKVSAASGAEVEYRSADSAVASVTGKGVVTAKKAGKTDISVLVTKDGVTEKVLIHVTVKKKKNVPEGTRNLGKVKVTKSGTPVIVLTKEMEVSGSSKIVVEKKEGVTLSYKTSDKAVATVTQSGKIKGKAVGTANVTATVKMNGVVQKYQVKVTVR